MKQCILAFLIVLFAVHAYGSPLLPSMPSATEIALLPPYCKVKFTASAHSPEYRMWLDRLGPKYLNFHHYCEGLNYINRYRMLYGDEHRDYYLSLAVPQIDIVAGNMPADFPLASEVYLNRGIAHKLMGNDGAAIVDFTKSIDHNPNQMWAYTYLVELYKKGGRKDDALKLVTIGLKRIPESKALQRIYLDLGGREPFPAPDQPLMGSAQDNIEPGVAAKPNPSIKQTTPEASTIKGETNAVDEETNQPKIGTPTNPYCRFCPPE